MPSRPNTGSPAAIAAAVAMIAAPGLVATPILGALGFSAGGIAAGSIAAGIQGVIGNVAARSLFAILQSAGAGGYGVAAIHGIVRVIGAVVGVGGIGDFFRGQGDGDDDSENEDGNGGNHGEGNNDKEEEAEKEKGEGDEQTDKLASIP